MLHHLRSQLRLDSTLLRAHLHLTPLDVLCLDDLDCEIRLNARRQLTFINIRGEPTCLIRP